MLLLEKNGGEGELVCFGVTLFYWYIKNVAVQVNVENLDCHFKSIVIYCTL